MKTLCLAAAFVVATIGVNARADVEAIAQRGTASFAFATVQEGRAILTERDDFVQRLSPFDRSSRLKSGSDVSEEAYLEFVAENVRAWTIDERPLVESALRSIRPRLDALLLPWPKTIYMVRTTGKEEGGASYTRGNAIVLPSAALMLESKSRGSLRRVISHELFHILTRNNRELKENLYAVIGFQQCGEIAFPSDLKPMKITNPDAPKNDHCIHVKVADSPTWAIPILFSRTARYDVLNGGEFFDYLQLRFLLVDGRDATAPTNASFDDKHPQLIEVNGMTGFFEQVGRNTDYLIHPEEILADNFAILVVGGEHIVSPEVINRIKKVLEEAQVAQPIVPADHPQPGGR